MTKTVTLSEKDLITSAAAATANLIRDIQANENYDKASRDLLSHGVAETGQEITAYLVALLFGNTTEDEEKENTPNEKRD